MMSTGANALAMSERNHNDLASEGGRSPLPDAQCDSNLGLALVHDSVLLDFQQNKNRPCSPSEEYQDKLSVGYEAQKGADIGGIILLNEQVDNESVSSSKCLPSRGEGGGATNGDVGDAQMSNATDAVPEQMNGIRGGE